MMTTCRSLNWPATLSTCDNLLMLSALFPVCASIVTVGEFCSFNSGKALSCEF